MSDFEAYMNEPDTWQARTPPRYQKSPVAYFCAEFGFHECLPIYCGGLGVLSGDHTKSTSDLGVPFAGVGLLYKNGYFTQRIDQKGNQLAEYAKFDFTKLPVLPLYRRNGKRLQVTVDLPGRRVAAQCWLVNVGRTQVILLDTDIAGNKLDDRKLTAQLYGGDRDTRILQEIILGIGGVRALRALGVAPAVWHLNEGHAALVVLQRIRELIERGQTFDDALEEVRRTTVFTTHTPVPAGHDAFSFGQVEKHLSGAWGTLGPDRDKFLALGNHDSGGGPQFNLTALALRAAGAVNAVSKLHR